MQIEIMTFIKIHNVQVSVHLAANPAVKCAKTNPELVGRVFSYSCREGLTLTDSKNAAISKS